MAAYFSIFDDTTLPGVLTHIDQAYNYGYYTTDWGSTESVLIIGTAFRGPTNQVVQIYSPEHALYVFGGSYDSKNRKEASLVTGIQDAYDRGCRAIYAIRVSGVQTYKDFDLAPDLPYKLRVSGIYPSNLNKDVYMHVDKTSGQFTVSIYKPSSRATIYEKKTGVVESDDGVIVNRLDLTNTYGYDKNTRLGDFVELVNSFTNNNVLRIAIVDGAGEDVTISDQFASSLPFESVFDGVYFIGRDKTLSSHKITTVSHDVAATDEFWANQAGVVTYKTLALNTDVASTYPISGSYNALREAFNTTISFSKFDFLTDLISVDALFNKDAVDYEEVELSDFELYTKLGKGFATTSQIVLKNPNTENPTAKDYLVQETPTTNANRIFAIKDGIYSTLENLPSSYRVLMNGYAKNVIADKLPGKEAFLDVVPGGTTFIKTGDGHNLVGMAHKVNKNTVASDATFDLKLTVKADEDIPSPSDITGEYSPTAMLAVPVVDSINSVPAGYTGIVALLEEGEEEDEYTLYKNKVALGTGDTEYDGAYFYTTDNNVLKFKVSPLSTVAMTSSAWAAANSGAEFFFVNYEDNINLYHFLGDEIVPIYPVGHISEALASANPGLYTVAAVGLDSKTFEVIVSESYVASTTLADFVADLRASQLGAYLTLDIASEYASYNSVYLDDESVALESQDTSAVVVAKAIYNTNKYIPYRTTDNFARQLAQHCTYTTLKTGSTHGVIGYDKISSISLNSIANKVEEAVNKDYDLYAKKDNGVNMRDRNNLPYDIGKDVSITFSSYYVTSPDGYRYVVNGAAGYAGMASALPLDRSSTNQGIAIGSLLFELSEYQLSRLTTKGYVTFKNSYTKGIVVTDGITMALASSEYKRLSTTRTVNYAATLIRAAVEPFIGLRNNLANRSSIKTAVTSSLNKIKNVLIADFSFTINADPSLQKLGIIDIDYTLVPLYEIRQIRNRLTIRDTITTTNS